MWRRRLHRGGLHALQRLLRLVRRLPSLSPREKVTRRTRSSLTLRTSGIQPERTSTSITRKAAGQTMSQTHTSGFQSQTRKWMSLPRHPMEPCLMMTTTSLQPVLLPFHTDGPYLILMTRYHSHCPRLLLPFHTDRPYLKQMTLTGLDMLLLDGERPTTSSAEPVASELDGDRPAEAAPEWSDVGWKPHHIPFTGSPGAHYEPLTADSDPVEFFQLFLTDEMLADIVVQTNLYAGMCIAKVPAESVAVERSP